MKFIKILLLTWSFTVQAALPPTTLSGQSATVKPTTFTFKAPYSQATQISGIESLIETGSENMLVNPGFEGGATVGVANGWTNVSGTPTITAAASEITSGKKAQKIVLSANSLGFLQEVSTPIGIQKQGVVGIAYATTVSSFQVCARVDSDAARDICVPSANLVLDGTYRTVEIPFVFGSVSAGIYIKSANATGTVLLDAAYIKQGLGTQNLQGDFSYTAQVTTTTGTVSTENKDFILSCTAANPTVCTFSTGYFTTAPNCNVSSVSGGGSYPAITSFSSTSVTIRTVNPSTLADLATQTFTLSCQKSGNDYLAASSNVYSAASANTDWAPCTFSTLAWQGLGTVTNSSLQCRKNNGMLEIKGRVILGTVTASEAQIPFPTNYGTITTRATSSLDSVGFILRDVATVNSLSNALATSGASVLKIGGPIVSTASNPITAVAGNGPFTTGDTISFNGVAIPIAEWSNSNYIVGSFQDVPTVPSAGARIDTFSVSYGTTNATTVCSASPCSYLDQIGNGLSSMTRTGTGAYTLNFNKTYTKIKCLGNGALNTASDYRIFFLPMNSANTNQISTVTRLTDQVAYDSFGTINCVGTY